MRYRIKRHVNVFRYRRIRAFGCYVDFERDVGWFSVTVFLELGRVGVRYEIAMVRGGAE